MIIAILGLGEAGSAFARDLLAVGVQVRGWDPAPRSIPEGIDFAPSSIAAVSRADVVLSMNAASVAVQLAREVAPGLEPNQLYADLNTAAPQNKREVAAIVEKSGALFIDGALLDPVPSKGMRTELYASGSGARLFAEKMSPLGMSITCLDDQAGNAATHKLVRSIIYKGVGAVVMECLEAAEALNLTEYARAQLMTLLRDEAMIDRFVEGSLKHAPRRIHEMQAVVEMLDAIGVSAFTSRASLLKLKEIMERKA